MTTGRNTFERFVADGRYCVSKNQVLRRGFAPTQDNNRCTIGFVCRERPIRQN